MRLPLLSELSLIAESEGFSMESLYRYLGCSRQGIWKAMSRRKVEELMMDEVRVLVFEYRKTKDRRAGSRSLYYNLDIGSRFGIGVNKFERLMSAYGLTLRPLRIKVVTTRSCYQSWNYSNLTQGLMLNNINQLVVGDLTYVDIGKCRYYLFSLVDVYSARIVGHHLGARCTAQDAYVAFAAWFRLRRRKTIKGCVHHTDGGSQYFSTLYLDAMVKAKLKISVAANCLDNGFSEQRNSLLKHHLIPTIQHTHPQFLSAEVEKVIRIYNYERKQERLGWLSPVEYERKIRQTVEKPTMRIYNRAAKQKTERSGFS